MLWGRCRSRPHLVAYSHTLSLLRVARCTGYARHKAGGEPLRQHRTKDRRHEHQHENHVEHAIVEQTLTCAPSVSWATNVAASVAATCGSVSDHTVSCSSRL